MVPCLPRLSPQQRRRRAVEAQVGVAQAVGLVDRGDAAVQVVLRP